MGQHSSLAEARVSITRLNRHPTWKETPGRARVSHTLASPAAGTFWIRHIPPSHLSSFSNSLKTSCEVPEGLENLLYMWTEDPLDEVPLVPSPGTSGTETWRQQPVTQTTHVPLVFQASVYSVVRLGSPLHSTSKHQP